METLPGAPTARSIIRGFVSLAQAVCRVDPTSSDLCRKITMAFFFAAEVFRTCSSDHDHDHLTRARLLRPFPSCFCERDRTLGGLDRLGVRGGALTDTAGDTLRDAGQTEKVIGKIPV